MIRLYRVPTGWIADMREAADVARVRQLFGTDQIPTAYTAHADPYTVRDAIARLNPEERVLVAQEATQ
jgi:hypothetical protein